MGREEKGRGAVGGEKWKCKRMIIGRCTFVAGSRYPRSIGYRWLPESESPTVRRRSCHAGTFTCFRLGNVLLSEDPTYASATSVVVWLDAALSDRSIIWAALATSPFNWAVFFWTSRIFQASPTGSRRLNSYILARGLTRRLPFTLPATIPAHGTHRWW